MFNALQRLRSLLDRHTLKVYLLLLLYISCCKNFIPVSCIFEVDLDLLRSNVQLLLQLD